MSTKKQNMAHILPLEKSQQVSCETSYKLTRQGQTTYFIRSL